MLEAPHQRRIAAITGISGQDGAYLARLLLQKGYRVIGLSRDASANAFSRLKRLGISDQVELRTLRLTEAAAVSEFIEQTAVQEIYHLSAQSSVARSFAEPQETLVSSAVMIVNLLEAVRRRGAGVRVFTSTSSECFGNTELSGATESTPFRPCSPYGVGKAMAHAVTDLYRNVYGLFCCSGILFNHESPLRDRIYVTQKIVQSAKEIAKGELDRLRLGKIDVTRDWGLANEYVEAMWLMLQQDVPNNYVIATGRAGTLREFLDLTFSSLGMKWQEHVDIDETLVRAHEIETSIGNPKKIYADLGWRAASTLPDVVTAMLKG
jgi:GDPmannose 4,6-dehydratase